MRHDSDFEKLARGHSLVTVSIIYYVPDYSSIVNEFLWQTLDIKPKYPRVEQFLDFWQREIEAVIKEIRVFDATSLDPSKFRSIADVFKV